MNWRTTLIGIAKLAFGVWYVIHKTRTGTDLSDVDLAVITLAVGGGVGNVLSADAKPQ